MVAKTRYGHCDTLGGGTVEDMSRPTPSRRTFISIRQARRGAITTAAVAAALAVLGGCGPGEAETSMADTESAASTATPTASISAAASEATPAPAPAEHTVAELLATLKVKGRAPMTGYDRDRFGQAWLDADRNGCDIRNDVLGEYLTDKVFKPGTGECVVNSGTLDDPYTGTLIDFVYGDGTLVDIDHVVALGNAWATGAFRWDIKKRAALANDPMNLLPVDASANRQKRDGDAATWLPSNTRFRCAYVARQVSVKSKYGLWVTPAERAAIERILATCPDQAPVPDSGAPLRVDQNITDPGAPTTTSTQGNPSGTVYYENCDAARAAGAAPVHRGDPGYGPHLDGDNDGIACE